MILHRRVSVLILSFCISCSVFSQDTKVKELELLCKTWGFFKYYHHDPSKLDWDNQFLTCYNVYTEKGINESLKALTDSHTLSDVIDEKYDSIPSVLDWINNGKLPLNIKENILYTFWNKEKFKNKFVEKDNSSGRPIFHEQELKDTLLSDADRFLALSRLWNSIFYFYPYRENIPNWDSMLTYSIPDILNARYYSDYYFSISKLISSLKDGHGNLSTPYFSEVNYFRFPPFWAKRVNEKVYVIAIRDSALGEDLGIAIGDEILKVGSKSIHQVMEEKRKLYPSAANQYAFDNNYYLFLGTKDDSTLYTTVRGDDTVKRSIPNYYYGALPKDKKSSKQLQVNRKYIWDDTVSSKKIRYMNLKYTGRKNLRGREARKLMESDYLIVDLRLYPRWVLHKLIRLLSNSKKCFALSVEPNYQLPGYLENPKKQYFGDKRGKSYDGKIIVLTDYSTLSRAEYTAMALQALDGTITIGRQSAGTDGNITGINLPGSLNVSFTGLGIYYPDLSPTQNVGVKIDFEVPIGEPYYKPRLEDEILQYTMSYIRKDILLKKGQ